MKLMEVVSALAAVALAVLVMPGKLSAADAAKVADLSYKCSSGKQGACRELAKIALNEPDAGVRGSAVLSLADQSVLAKVATEDKDSQVRYFAVSKLKDESLLAKIAVNETDSSVRHAALSALGKHMIEAAYRGDVAAVRSYLDRGCDVNSTDDSGYTALMYASTNGYIEIVQALLNKAANVNAKETDRGYAEFTANGTVIHQGDTNTALSLAIANNHPEIKELLIKAGAR